MDLRSAVALLRSRIRLLAGAVVVAVVIGYVVSMAMPKAYLGRATLMVGQSLTSSNPDYNQLLVSERLAQTYAEVATTRPVLQSVIADLNLRETPDDLRQVISVDAPQNDTILTVSATDPSPQRAADIANHVATQLIKSSPTLQGQQSTLHSFIADGLAATETQIQDAQKQVDSLVALPSRTAAQDAQLATLQSQLVTLRSTYATLLSYASSSSSNLLTVIEPAVAPTSPSSPRVLFNVLLAAVLGLLLAVGFIFLVEYVDDSVKSAEDVEKVAGLATLGSIARSLPAERGGIYSLTTLAYPRSSSAEGFRTLRTNVEFSSVDAPIRSMVVTSASVGEGKTMVSTNLSVAFAQSGRRTILVDADLRQPGAHELMGVPNAVGLTSLLLSDSIPIESVLQTTPEPNLRMVASGPIPPNPAELLGSQRMRALIERLEAIADVVIFDTPPLLPVTDAALLSSEVSATLLVVDVRRTRQQKLLEARGSLSKVGARVIGAVLNRVSAGPDEYYGRSPAATPERQTPATQAGA